ncbi:MAG: site-specific integrase [Rhodospirillales bacterium]|nr:site-specific integrase [Rhodospirillales bacterium]
MATFIERKNAQGEIIGYQVKIRHSGLAPQSKTFTKKADAKRWAEKIETEIKDRVFVSRKEADRKTLGDMAQRYLEEITPTHKGADQEAIRIKALKRYSICRNSMSALTVDDFAKWRDGRLAEVSAGTVIRELNLWHAIIETARREWGVNIPNNPVSLIRRPKPPPPCDRRINSKDEEASLLAACDEDDNKLLGPIVRIAIETAMRQGELCNLLWKDVNLERGTLTLRGQKNGDPFRGVPLSTTAIRVLEELKEGLDEDDLKGLVFPIDQNVLKMRFRRVCKRANIEGLRFHDLRHEATSRLFEKGYETMEVVKITGHKTMHMAMRYTHLLAERLREKLG